MRNKRRLTIVLMITLAVVLVAGGLMASNMGFKLNYPLKAGDGGVTSLSGTQSIGLPYNRQVGIDTARDLWEDAVASGVSIQNIQKFDIGTDQNVPYFGGQPDFNLTPGEGYMIKVGANKDYIVVGSHDPSLSLNLIPGSDPSSLSGTQRFAPPYHAVSSKASELFVELYPEVQQIQRFDRKTDQNVPYFGGQPDFNLVPGESYLVKVGSAKTFTPEHY
jgi:hypothetical protein